MLVRKSQFRTEWALLLGCLLTLGSVIAIALVDERQGLEIRERERLATQARVINDNLGRQLEATSRALTSIRDDVPFWLRQKDGMAEASRQLRAFTDAMPGVRSMLILDAQGTVLAASRPVLMGQNFSQRDYFQQVLRQPDVDTLYVAPPFTTSLGIWAINLVRMIPGPKGEFAGLVSATLDPDEFKIVLDSVRYAPDMWTAMAHGDGLQFVMVPEHAGQPGKNVARPGSFFSRHMAEGQVSDVMTGTVYATGEYRMMAQHTVQPAALHMNKPLVVAVARDMEAIFAEWRRDVWRQGGLFVLLLLVAVPGLHLLQRRRRAAEQAEHLAAVALRAKNTELEAVNAQLTAQSELLQSLAFVDGLTGVANRRRFDETLEMEWRRCRRESLPLSLLMIDIDYFKAFNDSYGHQAGDVCLRAVATCLREQPGRALDLVARYGGEEFVCLLPDTDGAGAQAKAAALCRAVAALGIPHGRSACGANVTVSIGVAALWPAPGCAAHELLASADAALYAAKSAGRNRVAGPLEREGDCSDEGV